MDGNSAVHTRKFKVNGKIQQRKETIKINQRTCSRAICVANFDLAHTLQVCMSAVSRGFFYQIKKERPYAVSTYYIFFLHLIHGERKKTQRT